MALADYFQRGALAAVQVLEGYDETIFRAVLDDVPVGIAFDSDVGTPEGDNLLDLLVRILARLYPRIALVGEDTHRDRLLRLAHRINPAIDIVDEADVGISVGRQTGPFRRTIYAGSNGWTARVSEANPVGLGDSPNPFGAGAAACLAASRLFRSVFLETQPEGDATFSVGFGVAHPTAEIPPHLEVDGAVLVGVGAIGNAAVWALGRSPIRGRLHLVDPEAIELGNLQRYILAERANVGEVKVEHAAASNTLGLELIPHEMSLATFLEANGYAWQQMLLALDSARDRCAAQTSLPRWIANGWTQPGDLGVSVHPSFGSSGECVSCLYLPRGSVPNEDELVTRALRVPHLQMQIRTLLHTGAGVDLLLLDAVAGSFGIEARSLAGFEGRPIRELYTALCGGALIPIRQVGRAAIDVHVPLPHQSALAGVLLGAALVHSLAGSDPDVSQALRVNVLRPLGQDLVQPLRRNDATPCTCQDVDFIETYKAKYGLQS